MLHRLRSVTMGVGLLMLIPFSAEAAEKLVPRALDPDLSALGFEQQCNAFLEDEKALMGAAAAKGNACVQARTRVGEFCKNPLGAKTLPSAKELEQALADECVQAPITAQVQTDGGIGSLQWQQDVVRGIAAFLVSRATAEAVASFAEHLKKDICEKGAGKDLLPLTCGLLAVTDAYGAVGLGGALKSTLDGDLKRLPYRYMEHHAPTMKDPKFLDAREFITSAVDVSKLVVESGENPLHVLAGLETRYLHHAPCDKEPVSCSLVSVGVAAQVLGPAISDQSPRTELFFRIATRLMVERLKKLTVLPAEFDTNRMGELDEAIRTFLASAKAVKEANERAANASKVLLSDKVANSEASLMEAIGRFASYVRALSNLMAVGEKFVTLRGVAPNSAELFASAKKGLLHFEESLEAVRKADYVRAIISLTLMAQDMGAEDNTPAWLKKYGPFIGQIATARNPEEVQKALEAAAVPVGGFRMKRGNGKANITLNGYLGLQGGYEWLGAAELPSAGSPRLGLFGPIGIEGSIGFGQDCKQSIGLFVSVLDVGALADFRLNAAAPSSAEGEPQVTVDQVPTFGFAQVFSPGAYLVYGVPNWPLVLGAGVSLTPQLRRVNFVESDISRDVSSLRVGAFAAIDVTLLNL